MLDLQMTVQALKMATSACSSSKLKKKCKYSTHSRGLMNLLEISEVLGLSVYRSSTPYISESLKVKEGSIISYLQNI